VPCEFQVTGVRRDDLYPAPISTVYRGVGFQYYDVLDQFIDEHLRLRREEIRIGKPYSTSPLYNGRIADEHFSPIGSALWARIIARRLDLLMIHPGETSG
jgi:hypothetical protein